MTAQPDNRAERRRRASREMRHLLVQLVKINPWAEIPMLRCRFCGAPAAPDWPVERRLHLAGCVWESARQWLRDHPQP